MLQPRERPTAEHRSVMLLCAVEHRPLGRSEASDLSTLMLLIGTADERAQQWEHPRVTDDAKLPETLTLDVAYRAAFFLTDQYIALESSPDEGLVLFHQYLQSDPARWEDWKHAVGQALRPEADPDPLVENLLRD